MAESTLKLNFTEIMTEVGRYLGYDRDPDNWSSDQDDDVVAIVKRGLRNFYFPQRVNPNEAAHRWSFLRPQATLTIWDDVVEDDAVTATISYSDPTSTVTASSAIFYPSVVGATLTAVTSGNEYTIAGYTSSTVVTITGAASGDTGDTIEVDSSDVFRLPWDFGGLAGDGRFTFDNSENKAGYIDLTSDVRIRQWRQSSVSTGIPQYAAIVPLTTDATEGQRWQAIFHPPPNDVLTLHYRYYILPDNLVETTAEYPYGSAAHSS